MCDKFLLLILGEQIEYTSIAMHITTRLPPGERIMDGKKKDEKGIDWDAVEEGESKISVFTDDRSKHPKNWRSKVDDDPK